MTEPTPRDIAEARELGLNVSDLKNLITLKKWIVAGPTTPTDDDPPAQAPTAT